MTICQRTLVAALGCTFALNAAHLPAQLVYTNRTARQHASPAGQWRYGQFATSQRYPFGHGQRALNIDNHNQDVVLSPNQVDQQSDRRQSKPKAGDIALGIIGHLLDSQRGGGRMEPHPGHGPIRVPDRVIIHRPPPVVPPPIVTYVPSPVVTSPKPLISNIVPSPANVPPARPLPVPKSPPIVKAPPKIWKLTSNNAPNLNSFQPGTKQDAAQARSAMHEQATKTLDALAETLPNDPQVKTLIEAAKNAIKEGKSLDPTWPEQLKTAVMAAGGPIDVAEANKLVKLIPGLVEANKLLAASTALGAGSNTPTVIPSGTVPVIICPHLVAGQMTGLPGGLLLVGTGGQGAVQIVTADAASVLGVPLGTGDPVADAPANAAQSVGGGVVLRNPSENGASVAYLIDSRSTFTLDPDYSQELTDGQAHEIRFDRGAGRGEAAYQLTPGTYAFTAAGGEWDLVKESFSLTIDNSSGPSDFHYVVDNRHAKVAAGQSLTHHSDYPIVVRFNRGETGSDGLKRITTDGERFAIAVNPLDGLWDLYPADNVPTMLPANIATASSTSPVLASPQPEGRLLSVLQQAGARF